MRIAVLSDIHANLHALEAVLAAVDTEGVDEVWCLGDIVGYGPRPNECVDLVRARADFSLCGNHDLAVTGGLEIAHFSGEAATAALWTRGELGSVQADWLRGLSPSGRRPGVELFHASPRDPVWDYVLSEGAARASMLATTEPVVLVGHSHVALAISWADETLDGGLAPNGTRVELAGARLLLNPGSVGQPRDGDKRAAWLLLGTGPAEAGPVENGPVDNAVGWGSFRRVSYAIEQTQAEIRARGLPEGLAARLAHGA